MDFGILFKRAGKVAAENSPAILTALGVSGTLTTAYLAAKAGFRSVEVLKATEEDARKHFFGDQSDDEGEPVEVEFDGLTKKEQVEAVWELYVPAVTTAVLTISAIILAARVQDRRNAGLAAAYTTVEKSYSEYRAKNVEKLGKKKEQDLRDELAQDRVDRNPVSKSTLIITNKGGETLCHDSWSQRYFTSSRNLIDRAVNDFNSQMNKDGYGSLSEFWYLIGLAPTIESDRIGWRADKNLLELEWSGLAAEHDQAAMSFTFRPLPQPKFDSSY